MHHYNSVCIVAPYTVNKQIFGPFLFSSVDLEMKIKRKICDDEKFVLWKISFVSCTWSKASRRQDNMMFICVSWYYIIWNMWIVFQTQDANCLRH